MQLRDIIPSIVQYAFPLESHVNVIFLHAFIHSKLKKNTHATFKHISYCRPFPWSPTSTLPLSTAASTNPLFSSPSTTERAKAQMKSAVKEKRRRKTSELKHFFWVFSWYTRTVSYWAKTVKHLAKVMPVFCPWNILFLQPFLGKKILKAERCPSVELQMSVNSPIKETR